HRPPHPPLFPYTTLFRSAPPSAPSRRGGRRSEERSGRLEPRSPSRGGRSRSRRATTGRPRICFPDIFWITASASLAAISTSEWRSEEHTSELQSLRHLVC